MQVKVKEAGWKPPRKPTPRPGPWRIQHVLTPETIIITRVQWKWSLGDGAWIALPVVRFVSEKILAKRLKDDQFWKGQEKSRKYRCFLAEQRRRYVEGMREAHARYRIRKGFDERTRSVEPVGCPEEGRM